MHDIPPEYHAFVRGKSGVTPALGRIGGDNSGVPLLWFDQITPVLDMQDFVQGLLIEKSLSLVYGASNSGKTFWATDLGLHIAAGVWWNGRRVKPGGVLYCALEGSIGFRNRVAVWKQEHGLAGYPVPFVAVTSPMNLRDPNADLEDFIALVKGTAQQMDVPLLLIIIDTTSRALAGGNENSPEDMGGFVMCMDRIREETGAGILLIHHSGKDQAKGARGHSLLQAAIDTEIEVVADDNGVDHTARVVKQRELRKGDVFPFTLKVVELGHNRHGETVTTCLVETGVNGAASAVRSSRKLIGHRKRALWVLENLVVADGRADDVGVPSGCLSVPEKWWRDGFYQSAMPGAEIETSVGVRTQDTKKHAFARASASLVEDQFVGMANGRVWVVPKRGTHRDIHRDRNQDIPDRHDGVASRL